MLSYGFFNSMNGDRTYNAEQMAYMIDALVKDGVMQNYGNFFSTQPGSGMSVVVQPGMAWFDSTWTRNDGQISLTISKSDISYTRYDAVVLEVNHSSSVRANSIKIVKGTAASSPKKPTLVNTDDVKQHPLAYIKVAPNVTTISSSAIDIRVGQSDCPWITGILSTVSIDVLFSAWNDEFGTWQNRKEVEFSKWFENLKLVLNEDVVTNLQRQIDDLEKNKLSVNGGTINGNLTIADGFDLRIRRSYTDGTGSNAYTPIRIFNGTTDGAGLVIQAAGLTMVGSGESAVNLHTKLIDDGIVTDTTEELYLTSDTDIYLVPNCNIIGNRKTVKIDKTGMITSPGGFTGPGIENFGYKIYQGYRTLTSLTDQTFNIPVSSVEEIPKRILFLIEISNVTASGFTQYESGRVNIRVNGSSIFGMSKDTGSTSTSNMRFSDKIVVPIEYNLAGYTQYKIAVPAVRYYNMTNGQSTTATFDGSRLAFVLPVSVDTTYDVQITATVVAKLYYKGD